MHLLDLLLQYYKTQFLRKIQEYNIKNTYHKDYYFTNTRNGKRDINKARRLVECLDVIGQNNIRALYVGVNKERKSGKLPTPTIMGANNDEEDNNQSPQNKKRPKFIGRLATTIIIEDGLWLG
ncbi:MAG: hypothetical protein MSL80_03215 [Helicobacter sp.]|uniref:hypothetical protein n=1 Tax=Helicobacter sp. TaxID=218 RepID=UPI003751BE71|nr:hypothetical protein [Helicobacter sp.]